MATSPTPFGRPRLGAGAALYDVDIGSPGGARWTSDSTDDPIAEDVRVALDSLLRTRVIDTPSGGQIDRSLLGLGGDSPSLIWTAQATGALFELGFTPDANCLQPHLDVIAARFTDGNWRNPLEHPFRDPWVLRARHASWCLSCLAEYQPPSPEPVGERQTRHRQLVEAAYDALVGSPTGDTPARWMSPKRGEFGWSEVWPDDAGDGKTVRRLNLLTSIYSVLGIARSERHGFRRYSDAWHAFLRDEQPPNLLVDHLLSQVHIEAAPDGPLVRLRDPVHGDVPWHEPWAHARTLPTSVIGLLALALVEYARFIGQIVEPNRPERQLARAAFMKAQRLGHALLARPRLIDVSWSRGVDAFFQQGGEDKAWFVPSYSVCLRAVLETGVADPTHPLVQDALQTISELQIEPELGGWRDPTYHTGLEAEAEERARSTSRTTRGRPKLGAEQSDGTKHAELDIRAWAKSAEADPESWGATAASVHAAAMALSATRRAWGRIDPRDLPPITGARETRTRELARVLPRCPFDTITITDDWTRFRIDIRDGEDKHAYGETTNSSAQGTFALLAVLSKFGHAGASISELVEALESFMPTRRPRPTGLLRETNGDGGGGEDVGKGDDEPQDDDGDVKGTESPQSLRSRLAKVNVFFGYELIETVSARPREVRYRIASGTTINIIKGNDAAK